MKVQYKYQKNMNVDTVLNIDTSEPVIVDVDGNEINMTLYAASRWLSLIKGIEVIDKKARQLKINLENDKSWVKPLALQKYIDEETPAMVAEIKTLKDKFECTI